MKGHHRRVRRPIVERMEGRELLSGVMEFRAARLLHGLPPASVMIHPEVPYQGASPTPQQQAREKFFAAFSGAYSTRPPSFFDQTSQTLIRGYGASTAFLHGSLQLLIVKPTTPIDPDHAVVGTAMLQDKSAATQGLLLVDISGNLGGLDSQGRPTHLTWTASPFGGSGSFTSGGFSLSTSQGTVDIHYLPDGPPSKGGVFGQGTAVVKFRGALYAPPTVNPTANQGLVVSHQRV